MKINKKSVLLFLSILLCVFILFLFLILHSRPAKTTSIVTNTKSGWSSFTGTGQYITAITWDKNNNLWVAGEEFGVSLIDETTIKTFDIPYCYTVLCDNSGKVWIGTLKQGLYSYDNGQWKNYNTSNGLPSNSIHALAVDKDNNLYCAVGLNLVKLSFGRWEILTLPDNLPQSEISCIDFDNEGNLWIGFFLGGVAKFDGYDWKLYRQKDGLDIDGRVNDILISEDETIWIATCSGIARSTSTETKDISFTVYKFDPMHPGYSEKEDPMGWSFYPANYFTSIAQYDSDNILFVNRHDPPRRWNNLDVCFMPFVSIEQLPSQKQFDKSRRFFYCITVDKDGYIWVGSYGGGIITNNSSFKFPKRVQKTKIELKETSSVDFSKQSEQKELIANTYKLLKSSPLKEQAYYIGEDWLTQGNWIGNYGEYAWILCGYYHYYEPEEFALDLIDGSDRLNLYSFKHVRYFPYIGENKNPGDNLKCYMIPEWELTDIPQFLQDPLGGGRRQTGWDDGAEGYPRPLIREGPHIYLDLDIPEGGAFIVSFYFMNTYDPSGMNRYRDFTISVKRRTFSEKDFGGKPLLTSCRVHDFIAGVYKRFILKGPGKYTIKFDKKESFDTCFSGIFIDKVEEP